MAAAIPTVPIHTEKELLQRLQADDQLAFTQLYHLYSARLYGNLLKWVKSPEVAEELLQDIFILVWEKRHTIDIHTGFRPYLFRIGENKVYDFFRKLRRDKTLYAYIRASAAAQYTHIEEALLSRENASLLQAAIETLPPQRRQVFELCKLQGKSYQEVGAQLGISASTINDHIVKATRTVRQYIYTHRDSAGILAFLFIINKMR